MVLFRARGVIIKEMKKNRNNIMQEWLDKYGTKEIEEQVKKEIKLGLKSPLIIIKQR